MNSAPSTYDAFIFTHIPKCGGTSFRQFINETAKQNGVPRKARYIPGYNWLSVEKDYHRLDAAKQKRLINKRYRVIAMHVGYGWHHEAAPYLKAPFYYTILRRPVNRVLSHYQFFNKGKGRKGVKNIELQNLTNNKRKEVLMTSANLPIQYILGKSIKGGTVTNMMRDDALENLEHRYGGFGLLEDLYESIKLLENKWPNWIKSTHSIEHINKSPLGENVINQVPKDIIDIIKNMNRLEIEFYDAASKLFYQRLKSNQIKEQ